VVPGHASGATLRVVEAPEPILRVAARALVFDPADRLLLVRFEAEGSRWWAAPGGGLEPGETHEAAILRELAEETGVDAPRLGPCVWTREHVFPWKGRVLRQRERYFVVRVDSAELRPRLSGETLAEEGIFALHWWPVPEIERSTEIFTPRRLAALVRELLVGGPPPEPFDSGV
jgi:8-oxo-dGTP pyrophosphatase MutT (NUDIX family)